MLEHFFGYFAGGEYWLTRLVFQRGLALVYCIAFLVAINQFLPLLGERGILPVIKSLSKLLYRAIASSRYRLFGKNEEVCDTHCSKEV